MHFQISKNKSKVRIKQQSLSNEGTYAEHYWREDGGSNSKGLRLFPKGEEQGKYYHGNTIKTMSLITSGTQQSWEK